jgi:hypothetical protein
MMRMILGLDRPTSGNALVNGHPFDRSRRPLNEMEHPIARSRDSSKADFTTVEITCICCQQAAHRGCSKRNSSNVTEHRNKGRIQRYSLLQHTLRQSQYRRLENQALETLRAN